MRRLRQLVLCGRVRPSSRAVSASECRPRDARVCRRARRRLAPSPPPHTCSSATRAPQPAHCYRPPTQPSPLHTHTATILTNMEHISRRAGNASVTLSVWVCARVLSLKRQRFQLSTPKSVEMQFVADNTDRQTDRQSNGRMLLITLPTHCCHQLW